MGPVIFFPVITHHKPNILYCITNLWNNMGDLLLWQFIYPLSLKKLLCWTQACVLSLYIMNVPVDDVCHGGCQLHVCFLDAVHNCLLHVILLCAMESSLWKLFACL